MRGDAPIEQGIPGSAPVILGTTLLNGGDAALALAEIATVAHATGHSRVVCYDVHAEVAQRYYPDLDVRPALVWPARRSNRRRRDAIKWALDAIRIVAAARAVRSRRHRLARLLAPGSAALETLETYRTAAAVLTPGGTMLVDQYRFMPRLVDALAGVTLGAPLIVFTQTLGAFSRRSDRMVAKRVFRKAALVLVRGERSRDRAVELGADARRVHVVADPVFLLNDSTAWTVSRPEGSLSVAISVRDWPHFSTAPPAVAQRRYEAAIADACRHLVRSHNAEVTFVSTCQGVPEYAFDDSAVAARIATSLEPDVAAHVTVDREFHPPLTLRALLGAFDLAISTRLHGCILALDAGTPVIPIAYEPKTLEVFERLEAGSRVLDIESLTRAALVEAIDTAVATLAEQRHGLRTAVEREARAAEDAAELIRAALAHHAIGRP